MSKRKSGPEKGHQKESRAHGKARGKPGDTHGAGVRDPYAQREARRYERPIPSREAILLLLSKRGELMKAAAIAEALDLHDDTDIEALDKRLRAMSRDGQVLQNRRGGFAPASKLDLIPGMILANAEGYGFLRPDDGEDDLYLSPAQMRRVLHGDRVLASVVGLDRRGRRQGAIVEILERRSPRLVGRIVKENGVTVVVPDDRRLHQDVLIPPDKVGKATSGQIVVVEMTEPPTAQRGPIGEVRAVLGDRLKPSLLVDMAIASHGLPQEFPEDVLHQAEAVAPQVGKNEHAGRTDIRKLPLVTIDGADARDFDDAVYAQRKRGGGYRLIVAIADVSHYVRPGTALDAEAFERSTSAYFPGFVVPMLPETLSNGICSLNPEVDRLCMVCDMSVGSNGDVKRAKFYPGLMRSHARLTYARVWQAIGERDADAREELADVLPQLDNLHGLYQALSAQRRRRGAIEFDTPETKFRLADNGEVQALGTQPRNDAHKLIEECMIAANVQAAKFLERKKIPALYRQHATPPKEKYEDLLEFLREFKLSLPPHDEVEPADFTDLLRKVHDRPEAELIQSVLLRSQSMAIYHPENQGHFGLALDAYAHFTSPIRRYPDLLVHRAIRYALKKGKPADYTYGEATMASMAVHCSQRERRAEEAERDVDDRYKCAWMEKHVGETFDGVVTGVTSFGLFVEMRPSHVSGLVHISQLSNDYYHFDPTRRLLQGEHTGQKFRLGDDVRVQVLRASLEDRKIDLRMVTEETSDGGTRGSTGRHPPGARGGGKGGGKSAVPDKSKGRKKSSAPASGKPAAGREKAASAGSARSKSGKAAGRRRSGKARKPS